MTKNTDKYIHKLSRTIETYNNSNKILDIHSLFVFFIIIIYKHILKKYIK